MRNGLISQEGGPVRRGKKEDSGSGGRGREEVGEDDSPFPPLKKENKNTVVLRTHSYRIFQGRRQKSV